MVGLEIVAGKFYGWKLRYGTIDEYNSAILHDRRLCFMESS